MWDVAIAGAGPAGAVCAAFCARAGLKVLVLERAAFPREKVCGDCLNPLCWPLLDELGAASEVLALPHSKFDAVEIAAFSGETFRHPLEPAERGEIAVKRSAFDALLARHAATSGAEIMHGQAITAVERIAGGWKIRTSHGESFTARQLVAADGRNSTVARLLGHLPAANRERAALQAHLPSPAGFGEKALLKLLPYGYCGVASVGGGQINLCLVGAPHELPALKRWAIGEFALDGETAWRSIAPIARAPLPPVDEGKRPGLVLIGDAARVVEPFTGEGIYYAMASARLAAAYLAEESGAADFRRAYRELYAGRLWINRLAKLAVTHPRAGNLFLKAAKSAPGLLGLLTSKVVGKTGSLKPPHLQA